MKFAALVLLALMSSAAPAADALRTSSPAAKGDGADTPPRMLTPIEAQWPEGLEDHEALVYVRLVVSTTGEVADARVLSRGFYQEPFATEAMRAARLVRFSPATQNGIPYEMALVMPVVFGLGEARTNGWATGITDEFRVELNKLGAMLEARDYAGAQAHAEWMLHEKVRFACEFAALNAQLAQVLAAAGDPLGAIEATRAATERFGFVANDGRFLPLDSVQKGTFDSYLLPKDAVVALLELRMKLAAANGLLLDSLRSFQELQGLVAMKAKDPHVAFAARLRAAITDTPRLVGRRKLIASRTWTHELRRRSFTLANIKGSVDTIELSCDTGRTVLEYSPGVDWHVPAGSKKCSLGVNGKPGTEFEVVEFQDSPAPAH